MAGKDKIARGMQFQIDDGASGTLRDISDDIVPNSVDGMGWTAGEISMTGEGEATENFLGDRKTNTLRWQVHMNDTASTGGHTVCRNLPGVSDVTITIDVGSGGAAPTTGDVRFTGEFTVFAANQINIGGAMALDCYARPADATSVQWTTTP